MKRPGFTVIELIVVILIIGLLSLIAIVGMRNSQIGSRDAKRVAELHQMSQAVELFFNEHLALPTGASGWCTYVSNPTYPQFINDIQPYMAQVPRDPKLPNQVGDYFFDNIDSAAGKYGLCATMEKATGKSYDYSACAGGAVYNYCIFPNGQ